VSSVTQSEIGTEYVHQHHDTMYTRGDFYRYERGVWERQAETTIRREVWQALCRYESVDRCRPTANMLSGGMRYIEDHVFIPENQVDVRPNLINLLNGTYDLELQGLLTHNQAHYLTTQLPFAYDPDATCPTWQYFLHSSLTQEQPHDHNSDPELAMFLQEAVGYSLTTDISHHVSFWCYGRGG